MRPAAVVDSNLPGTRCTATSLVGDCVDVRVIGTSNKCYCSLARRIIVANKTNKYLSWTAVSQPYEN